ncbi:MAG TPA: hypothetical protein EYP85_12355 [Armatimonadetes bacterium]|nr:hypothetical protein [Armatimonadota bacterium]
MEIDGSRSLEFENGKEVPPQSQVLLLLADRVKRGLLGALLQERGFTVEGTDDWLTALAHLAERQPEVLVVDLSGLPQAAEGLAQLRQRVAQGEYVPRLVVLTDSLAADLVGTELQATVLTRPVRLGEVAEAVRRATRDLRCRCNPAATWSV